MRNIDVLIAVSGATAFDDLRGTFSAYAALVPPVAAGSVWRDDMTIEGILITLLIGAIAGWLAGQIVRGAGFGLIGNIVIGIVGAFVAGLLLPGLGILATQNALVNQIIFATIGAIIVLVILSLIRRTAV